MHIKGDPYDFGGILRFGGLAPPPSSKIGPWPPPVVESCIQACLTASHPLKSHCKSSLAPSAFTTRFRRSGTESNNSFDQTKLLPLSCPAPMFLGKWPSAPVAAKPLNWGWGGVLIRSADLQVHPSPSPPNHLAAPNPDHLFPQTTDGHGHRGPYYGASHCVCPHFP